MWERQATLNGKTFTAYTCRFSPRNGTPSKILPKNCSKVPYSGFVYDLTVPSHVFLVRHNGRASWTGNSWRGHLTLEFSNSSGADCRLYANEGICQMLLFEGDPCDVTYHDRAGKYQDQPETIVTARV